MGILISLLFLIINLTTNSHYGYTWDLPHHFNAGLRHLGLPPLDPSFGTQPYGPIADTLPVIGWLAFYKNWHILPPDEAYHFFLICAGALGVFIIYKIAKEMFGSITALFSATFLALYPRYIGHSHNNMKDGLSAVAVAFAIWMFVLLVKNISKSYSSSQVRLGEKFIKKVLNLLRRSRTIILASLAVAIAFNTKVNALLLPLIIGLWLLVSFHDQIQLKLPKFWLSSIGNIKLSTLLIYAILSIFFSLLFWWLAWPNPFFQLTELFRHFSETLHGFNVLYFGKIYFVGINTPWYYALGYFFAVTPLIMLFFVFIGLAKTVKDTILVKNRYSFLILTWFFVPTLKYLDPKIGVFDDIRHYLEAVFPLCIMAGIGISIFYKYVLLGAYPIFCSSLLRVRQKIMDSLPQFHESIAEQKKLVSDQSKKSFAHYHVLLSLYLIIIFYLLFQSLPVHPYETSYFSETIGGIKGAQGKFDIEFWGNSLKEGSLWLNKNIPSGSTVSVPMAQHLAREYLRPDINVVQYADKNTDYLMFFNRQSFMDMYPENRILKWYLANRKPLFTIERDGVNLLWIYRYNNDK